MAGLTGRAAAWPRVGQWRQWAVHVGRGEIV